MERHITESRPVTRWHKLAEELKEYAAVSLYLYVCFGAVLLFKVSVLEAQGVGYAPYGLAAGKALILGKFMLMGQAVHLGERHRHTRLIYTVLYHSAIFLVALIALLYLEELLVGAIHGRPVSQSISEIADGKWAEMAATSFVLWLILLPYFGFRQISKALGDSALIRMLFEKH